MAKLSKPTKRREWWIDPSVENEYVRESETDGLIKVREVIPGEVCITRDELLEALEYFTEYDEGKDHTKQGRTDFYGLLNALFGPLIEGTDHE